MELPEKYLLKMQELLKDDYPAYLASLKQPVNRGLRVNTSKISIEEFLRISPFHLTPIPWCHDGFYYAQEDDPSHHPFYYAGMYYLQDASAMAPAEMLDIQKGDLVLDGCCAPGGKALKLAGKLQESGLLVANDISFSRQKATLRNLERAGFTNTCIISGQLSDLSDSYDKILLDVPCSGEGMFRKDPSLVKAWLTRDSSYYVPLQKQLLMEGLRLLNPGGSLLYSTCTFDPQENEDIILYALDKHNDIYPAPLPFSLFAPGVKEKTENCGRIYPFKLEGEGQFLALLRKKGERQATPVNNQFVNTIHNESLLDFLSLINRMFTGTITGINDMVLLAPNISQNHGKARILRNGLLMGTMKNNRFEPSQALAMSLHKDEFASFLSLNQLDALRYLRGETLKSDVRFTENSWVLIGVEGYPLGFGKYEQGRIKNKIDPGWRIT